MRNITIAISIDLQRFINCYDFSVSFQIKRFITNYVTRINSGELE